MTQILKKILYLLRAYEFSSGNYEGNEACEAADKSLRIKLTDCVCCVNQPHSVFPRSSKLFIFVNVGKEIPAGCVVLNFIEQNGWIPVFRTSRKVISLSSDELTVRQPPITRTIQFLKPIIVSLEGGGLRKKKIYCLVMPKYIYAYCRMSVSFLTMHNLWIAVCFIVSRNWRVK